MKEQTIGAKRMLRCYRSLWNAQWKLPSIGAFGKPDAVTLKALHRGRPIKLILIDVENKESGSVSGPFTMTRLHKKATYITHSRRRTNDQQLEVYDTCFTSPHLEIVASVPSEKSLLRL